MRVTGSIQPEQLRLEPDPQKEGFYLIRLTENVKARNDAEGAGYEYDEYVMSVKYYDGIQHDIQENIEEWLATGRSLECSENASTVCDMRETIAENLRVIEEKIIEIASLNENLAKYLGKIEKLKELVKDLGTVPTLAKLREFLQAVKELIADAASGD